MRKPNWGSWKTTIGGIAAILTGLGTLGKVINDVMIGNPVHFDEVGIAITALGAGITGLFARDNNVSSEDTGIK